MSDGTNFIPILIWFGVGAALVAVLDLMPDAFLAMIFAVPALVGYVAAAIVLLIAYVRNARKERTRRAWIAVGSIPSLMAVLMLIPPLISTLVLYARFVAMLPSYERVVATVLEMPQKVVSNQSGGIEYLVDIGPPVRLAFPKDGILDNWWGIVYDPSNAVAQAKGWSFESGEQRFTAPREIRAVFGGDLLACRHLYRYYYSCSFT